MLNNVAIDVCLGIVFIILLYSLLASIVQEIVARWMGLRSRLLQKAIRRMLEDGDSRFDATLINFFIDFIRGFVDYFRPLRPNSITKQFFEYPLIKYLAESNWNSKPSYISARNFSQTLIELLRGEGYSGAQNQMDLILNNIQNRSFKSPIDAGTLGYIRKMWVDSNHDIDRFDGQLQNWYNDTMLRVTGWYKRQTQFLLFLIGFTVASSFNVDLIAIGQILANDNKIREKVIEQAASRKDLYGRIIDSIEAKKARMDTGSINAVITINDTASERILKDMKADALSMQKILGLGFSEECTERKSCVDSVNLYLAELMRTQMLNRDSLEVLQKRYANCKQCKDNVSPYQNVKTRWVGWLLTALAISLGAPFWFDLLNKIMMLRGTGTKPPVEAEKESAVAQATVPPVKPKG